MEIKGGGIYGAKSRCSMHKCDGCDLSVLYNKDVASILISRGHKYQAPSHSNDISNTGYDSQKKCP
jgi:hypothetical protein